MIKQIVIFKSKILVYQVNIYFKKFKNVCNIYLTFGVNKIHIFTQAAFIWSEIQQKQLYCKMLLQFKITVFCSNIF